MKIMPHETPNISRARWYQIAEENGVSKGLFYNRLRQGWSEQRAAKTPKGKYQFKQRPPKSEITKMAEQTGISYSTIHSRLNRGWSVEKATTTPLKRRGNGKGVWHG